MSSAALKLEPLFDPTVYPSEDDMAEGSLQRFISEQFRALVERYLEQRGTPTFVGANQFIYWKQFDPSRTIAPDVFVLPDVEPGIKIDSWKTWETSIVPSFALEVVSQDYLKDYSDGPGRYDALGVRELVIFDPEYKTDLSERMRFQVYRRLGKRGLVRVEATNNDRVRSKVLSCWLRAVGKDTQSTRLRIATGPTGETLLPTAEEAEQAERAARAKAEAVAEAERAARAKAVAVAEAERAARAKAVAEAEAERAARAQAEASLAQAEAET